MISAKSPPPGRESFETHLIREASTCRAGAGVRVKRRSDCFEPARSVSIRARSHGGPAFEALNEQPIHREQGGSRNIQYLRGVAATSVALFHTSVNMSTFAWPSSLARDFGDCGIDVFFVISGFVMFFVTKDNSMSPRRVLLRRIIRIVPLYWLATIWY